MCAVFFLGVAFYLGAAFFFEAAFFGLEAAAAFFLQSALSLYELLTWTRSPPATAFFRALKNVAFIHFLWAGKFACMCFLIAMVEEPVPSLSSVMAAMIPAF